METSKPISTISWNSEPFLKGQLDMLINNGVIDFWSYIRHDADAEEVNKTHFHIYLEPHNKIDTSKIIDALTEFIPNEKPIKPSEVRKSNFDDWYFYGLHDRIYLIRSKHYAHKSTRYDTSCFVSSDADTFNLKSNRARRPEGAYFGGDKIRFYMAEYVLEKKQIPNLSTAMRELGIMPNHIKDFYALEYQSWNDAVNGDGEEFRTKFIESASSGYVEVSKDKSIWDILEYFDH